MFTLNEQFEQPTIRCIVSPIMLFVSQ